MSPAAQTPIGATLSPTRVTKPWVLTDALGGFGSFPSHDSVFPAAITQRHKTLGNLQGDKLQLDIPAGEQEVLRSDTQLSSGSGERHTVALQKEDSGT